MVKVFKNFVIAIAVLAVSAGIFFIVEQDRVVKENVLRTTLDMFGKQLLGMVKEGEDKEELKRQYAEFMQKAEEDKMPEQEIEQVVADILNLSTQDTVVDVEFAMSLLNTEPAPEPPTPELEEEPVGIAIEGPEVPTRTPHKRLPPPERPLDRKRLARRLSRMHEFQIQLQQLEKHNEDLETKIRQQYAFVADSGLRVVLSPELLHQFDDKKYRDVRKNLQELERQNQILVHDKFSHNLRHQLLNLRVQMDQLNMPKIDIQLQECDSLLTTLADSLESVGVGEN